MDVDVEKSQSGPDAATAAGQDRQHARNPNPNSPDKTTKRLKTNTLGRNLPLRSTSKPSKTKEKAAASLLPLLKQCPSTRGAFLKPAKTTFLLRVAYKPNCDYCAPESWQLEAPEGTYTATAGESTSLSNQVLQVPWPAWPKLLAWCSKEKRRKFYVLPQSQQEAVTWHRVA